MARTASGEQAVGPQRRSRVPIPTGFRRATRRLAMACWDSAAWAVGLTAAVWIRYDGDAALIDSGGLVRVLLVALVAHWAIAVALQLYRGRYWIGSVDDAIGVTATMAPVGIMVFVVVLLPSLPPVPRSVPLTGALVALMLSVGGRVAVRRWQEHLRSAGRRTCCRIACSHAPAGVTSSPVVRTSALALDGGWPSLDRPWPAPPHFDDGARAVPAWGRVDSWAGEQGEPCRA